MSNPTTPFYPMTHDDAQELIAAIGDNSKMAAAYDPTRTYELNDHCIYSGGLYRCTTAITIAEQWTPAHWESITVGEELTETSKGLAKLIPVISGAVNNSGYTIASGEYFEANGALYQATASIPIGSAWASSGSAVSGTAINSLNSNSTTRNAISAARSGDAVTGNYIQFGKMVVVNVAITLNSAVEVNAAIISGIPSSDGVSSISGFKNASGERGTAVFVRTQGNNLIANTTLQVGTYIFSGSYIAS